MPERLSWSLGHVGRQRATRSQGQAEACRSPSLSGLTGLSCRSPFGAARSSRCRLLGSAGLGLATLVGDAAAWTDPAASWIGEQSQLAVRRWKGAFMATAWPTASRSTNPSSF